ncbi:MAG: hypothetical protein HOW73_17890 [Polyangiaceae bacterium]|nr:hypothetical protein [Polyangiaceae bacterium]
MVRPFSLHLRLRALAHGCLWLVAALTPLFAGCGGAAGALGQVAVADDCAPSDASCRRRGFDKPIAVGAVVRPEISMRVQGSGAPSMHYEAADPTVLKSENGRVEGVAPGMSAVLIMTDDGTVMDMFHVWVKAPTGIDLVMVRGADDREPIEGTVELFPGEVIRLEAALHGEGQELGGELEQEWSLDRSNVTLLEEGRRGARRLVALEPGEAKLTLHAGDAYTSLRVVVRKPSSAHLAQIEVSR